MCAPLDYMCMRVFSVIRLDWLLFITFKCKSKKKNHYRQHTTQACYSTYLRKWEGIKKQLVVRSPQWPSGQVNMTIMLSTVFSVLFFSTKVIYTDISLSLLKINRILHTCLTIKLSFQNKNIPKKLK